MERPEPDLLGIADPRMRRRIEKAVERSILEPVFETVVQRTTRHLHAAEGELELALDDGIVRAGGSENSLCEAELELKSGNPECLLQTAAQLFAASPVRLAKGSQAERGYRLALGKANGRVEPQRSEPAAARRRPHLRAGLHPHRAVGRRPDRSQPHGGAGDGRPRCRPPAAYRPAAPAQRAVRLPSAERHAGLA